MLLRTALRRCQSTSTRPDFFALFPKTVLKSQNAQDKGFSIDTSALRKEYRKLQAANHPDLTNELNSGSQASQLDSAVINSAYETLRDPLKRAQYIISSNTGLDLQNDEIGQKYQFQDKQMLLEMMDVHERLEEAMKQSDLDDLKQENDARIENLLKNLSADFKDGNWDAATTKTVRLKYCYNIKNALKNWSPGEQVVLDH